MSTHVLIENKTQEELFTVIGDNLNNSNGNDHDLVIVCKDNQKYRTDRKLMGMLSPMLRNILGSLCSLDICMLFLPDFQLHTVEKVLELLLSLQWKDKVITLTEEQVELLTCLDIKPGEISRVEAEDKVTINPPEWCTIPITKDVIQAIKENISESNVTTVSNINITVTKETIRTQNVGKAASKPVLPSIKTITTQPVSIPTPKLAASTTEVTSLIPAQVATMMNIARTVKCPMCSKTFCGTNVRMKDKLKCHIGFVHYGRKINKEIDRLFEENKCSVCMEDFVNFNNKKKHLIWKHCKYVDEIQSSICKAMKANANVTKKSTKENNNVKKKYENSPSDLCLVSASKLATSSIPTPNVAKTASKPEEISRVEAEDKVTINTPELSLSSCPLCDADIVDSVEDHINSEHEDNFPNIDLSILAMATYQNRTAKNPIIPISKIATPVQKWTSQTKNIATPVQKVIYPTKLMINSDQSHAIPIKPDLICLETFKTPTDEHTSQPPIIMKQSKADDISDSNVIIPAHNMRAADLGEVSLIPKDIISDPKIRLMNPKVPILKAPKENMAKSKITTTVTNKNINMTNVTIPTTNDGETVHKHIQQTLDESHQVPQTITTTQPTPKLTASTTKVSSLIPAQRASITNNARTVKCPMCSRTFGGTKSQTSLKCHIGLVHYGQKIKEEIERLFEGNKCTVCMKDIAKIDNMKKHLIYNHSKYAEEIQSATNDAMKANSIVTKNIGNETNNGKQKDENYPSLVQIPKLTEPSNVSKLKHTSMLNQDILTESSDVETDDEDMVTDKIQTSINKEVERNQTNEKDRDEERKEQKDEMVEECHDVRIAEEDCKKKETEEDMYDREENGRKEDIEENFDEDINFIQDQLLQIHDMSDEEEDRMADFDDEDLAEHKSEGNNEDNDDCEQEYKTEEMEDEEDKMGHFNWYLMQENILSDLYD